MLNICVRTQMSPAAAFNRVTQMHAVVLVPTVMTYCSNESIVAEASELLEISGCCFLLPSFFVGKAVTPPTAS